MGKKKQKKQQQKKSGKKNKAVKEKGKKKLDALKEERRQLQLQVAELQRRLEEASKERQAPPDPQPLAMSGAEFPRKPRASHHKIDWERYTYLHDRYEVHVEKGEETERARSLANEELRAKFGNDAGYTDEQLEAIFLSD